MIVYLAIVYTNDYIDEILVFETLEKAINFKEQKDNVHNDCEIIVRIEQCCVR